MIVKAHKAQPEMMVLKALKEIQVHKAQLVQQDRMVPKVLPVHRVQQESIVGIRMQMALQMQEKIQMATAL